MGIVFSVTVAGLLSLQLIFAVPTSSGVKVLIGNDDGWAEANVRALYQTLKQANYKTVLSAPVTNQSGKSSCDVPAKPLKKAGQYDLVPAGAPAQGTDASDPGLNYVNSYPVTAIKYGIQTLAPKLLGGAPDIVVTGPNVGSNLGAVTLLSGTVGAATEAAKEGIPAIAFSGRSGPARSYTMLRPNDKSFVYAEAAQKLINTLTKTAKPWLPKGTALNVNLPVISPTCASINQFKFVLTRLYNNRCRTDVVTCNNSGHLPHEFAVIYSKKCYVTVSVFDASNKRDASVAEQAAVLDKLKTILECADLSKSELEQTNNSTISGLPLVCKGF